MKAKDIAAYIRSELIGDPSRIVSSPGYLHSAKPADLVYCLLKDDQKDIDAITQTNAGVVIVSNHLRDKLISKKIKPTVILSEAPKYDFARVLQRFFSKELPKVSSNAYIGNRVKLGEYVDIHPGVVIYDKTTIGNRVTIRANAVLGAEGLDYGRSKSGELMRVPHTSSLLVEDDVDIGSNTTVQKGILRPTIIGKGSKIGPNCNIGHEVVIGENCVVTGMTMVAGATEIGDNTFIAPHSTIKNSIIIGKNVFVGIGSLVINSIPDNSTVVGRPAIELEKFRASRKRLKELLGES